MDYTSTDTNKMPSPKSCYFKVVMPSTSNVGLKWMQWADKYKPTQLYAIQKYPNETVHYFGFTEEKLAVNLITLLNYALGNDIPVDKRANKAEKLSKEEITNELKKENVIILVTPPTPALDACKLFAQKDEELESVPLETREFSFDFTIKNMKTIDTAETGIKTLALRTFDICIPIKNDPFTPYRIRTHIPVLVQGMTCSSNRLIYFYINGSLYDASNTGQISTEIIPGDPNNTTAKLMQEIAYGIVWDTIEKNFRTSDDKPKYKVCSWLELSRVNYPILHGINAGDTLNLHCVSVFEVNPHIKNHVGSIVGNFQLSPF